mmetsp:Transcript_29009/g.84282  ORF Transcript_29009/g.84282 Transcript_29009/m.84282 type:complete len:84 (+) Transcript_29009:477-728(+)
MGTDVRCRNQNANRPLVWIDNNSAPGKSNPGERAPKHMCFTADWSFIRLKNSRILWDLAVHQATCNGLMQTSDVRGMYVVRSR